MTRMLAMSSDVLQNELLDKNGTQQTCIFYACSFKTFSVFVCFTFNKVV